MSNFLRPRPCYAVAGAYPLSRFGVRDTRIDSGLRGPGTAPIARQYITRMAVVGSDVRSPLLLRDRLYFIRRCARVHDEPKFLPTRTRKSNEYLRCFLPGRTR